MSQPPPREPVRAAYDAEVGLTPHRAPPQRAYALVKFTFSIHSDGRCRLAQAEPMLHDLRDESLEPRLRPGTDFHISKERTDFVVQGSAFAPEGRAVEAMYVGVEVGGARKYIRVTGDREIRTGAGGRVSIGPAQPFVQMPLTWDRAYGGIDWRAPVLESDPCHSRYLMEADHPGIYPRNHEGRGYLVAPPPAGEPALMPNLEDPEDLLSEERLVVSDPRYWFLQPLPWCFDWVHPFTFPRHVYFGTDPWYPAPEDASLSEIRRGFTITGYRTLMAGRQGSYIHPDFVQEASHGLIFPQLRGDEVVTLHGMNPHLPVFRFQLPFSTPPYLTLEIEGTSYQPTPRLHSVVCRPAEYVLTMVYGLDVETPRLFIPGIHKHIPLALRVGSDDPVPYSTPMTVKERIRQAQQQAAQPGGAS